MIGKTITGVEFLGYYGTPVPMLQSPRTVRITFTDGSTATFKAEDEGYGDPPSIDVEITKPLAAASQPLPG